MDNLENLKNEIKIPSGIDLSVKKGIERGRKERNIEKHKKIYIKIAASAAILVVTITATVGIVNPSAVQAIPGIQAIFKLMNHDGDMGESFDKYEQFSTSVNKSVKKNGIRITMNEITIDNNSLAITSTVEGKDLRVGKGDVWPYIKLNGKSPGAYDIKDKKIDNNKVMMVTYANITDLNLPDNVDIDIYIPDVNKVKGPWNLKFKVSKNLNPTNSKTISLDKSMKLPESTLKLEKLVISPLGNTLVYSGIYDHSNESLAPYVFDFIVIDEKGRIVQTKDDKSYNKERYNGRIEIFDDLSNIKSLTVVPILKKWGLKETYIDKNIYNIFQTTINSTNFNLPQETITKTRPITAEEKSKGYKIDNVTHIFNIDKAREFCTIDRLMNQVIKVGDSNTAVIKNIEATEKETKVTFKIEGNGAYSYANITSAVILDENYNDVSEQDADIAVMENMQERLVSIKLPPIDKTKKYKIALPITDQPEIQEQYKMNIDLTK